MMVLELAAAAAAAAAAVVHSNAHPGDGGAGRLVDTTREHTAVHTCCELGQHTRLISCIF